MHKLLTQKDLAERWQLSVKAIENCRKDGVIAPVQGVPGIRFNPQQIEELEGVKLTRFSPLERKKMEREIERLETENQKLKEIISDVLASTSRVIGIIN